MDETHLLPCSLIGADSVTHWLTDAWDHLSAWACNWDECAHVDMSAKHVSPAPDQNQLERACKNVFESFRRFRVLCNNLLVGARGWDLNWMNKDALNSYQLPRVLLRMLWDNAPAANWRRCQRKCQRKVQGWANWWLSRLSRLSVAWPSHASLSSHVKLWRRGDGLERTERKIAREILMKKLCMKKDLCFALACPHFGLRNRPKTFSASMKVRWKLSTCARPRQQCIWFLKQISGLTLLCFQRPTLGLHSCRCCSCYLCVSCPGVDYEGRVFALLRLTSPPQRGQEMQL